MGHPAPDLGAARQLVQVAERERQSLEPASLLACLQPGPEALVTGLVDAHLLESQGEGRLVFRMRWLLRWAEERHLARLAHHWTVDEIGEALLQTAAWQGVVDRLLTAAQANHWLPIQRIAAEWQPDDPVRVVALEAAFLAAGLGLMMGASAPDDLCAQLWDCQRRTLVTRFSDHHRLPSLLPVEDGAWAKDYSRKSWALAAIAITERVPSARLSGLDQGLAPWLDDEAREPLRRILVPVQEFWAAQTSSQRTSPEPLPWARGAFALGARLLERHGPLTQKPDGGGLPCLVFLPALLARHMRGEDHPNVETWDLSPIPLEVILSEATQHGLSEAQTLEALWRLAGSSSSIMGYLENILEENGQFANRLWRTYPPALLANRLSTRPRSTAVPFENLTDEQWIAILEPLRRNGLYGDEAARVWRHLPWHLFERLVREQGSWEIMHEAARVMWSLNHDRVRELTRKVLPNNAAVLWLLWTMPFDTFLEELDLWLYEDATSALYVSSRLHAHACQRGPRWRESWAWLRRLQMGGDGQPEAGAPG